MTSAPTSAESYFYDISTHQSSSVADKAEPGCAHVLGDPRVVRVPQENLKGNLNWGSLRKIWNTSLSGKYERPMKVSVESLKAMNYLHHFYTLLPPIIVITMTYPDMGIGQDSPPSLLSIIIFIFITYPDVGKTLFCIEGGLLLQRVCAESF